MEQIALSDRYQFPVYLDRAAFKKASGVDAPIWNPAYPIKQWFDPSPKPGINTYKVLNSDPVNPALVGLPIPAEEAATVNLPGVPEFKAYAPAPTTATQSFHFAGYNGPANPVDVFNLSTKAEADGLASVCGAQVVEVTSPFYNFNWGSETRRLFKLIYKNTPQPVDVTVAGVYVGQLLKQINSRGVGAPYHFSASQLAQGVLEVVNETIPDGAGDHPTMPIPLALKPGEEPQSVMIGPGIYTVMIGQKGATQPSGTGTGGDTDLAKDTNAKVTKILKAMNL